MTTVSIFSIIISQFYAKHHLLAYFNKQQIYRATLWSALIFQFINSLNIAQFIVKMRSNKNYKMAHSRKKVCELEGFYVLILTHNGYCFYFSTELAKFLDNFINLE